MRLMEYPWQKLANRLPQKLCGGGAADSLYLNHFGGGLGIDWQAPRFEKERLCLSPGDRIPAHREGFR